MQGAIPGPLPEIFGVGFGVQDQQDGVGWGGAGLQPEGQIEAEVDQPRMIGQGKTQQQHDVRADRSAAPSLFEPLFQLHSASDD